MRKGPRSWRPPVALWLLPVVLVAGCQADPVAPPPPPPHPPIVVGVSPLTAEVPASGALTLSASVVNDTSNGGVAWTLSGPGCAGATCGTLSVSSSASGAAVAYTAPSTLPDPATVTVTATSVTDNAKSASATVTVVPAPLRLVFASVSAGGSHSCGVTTAGAMYCWGNNQAGAIGSGSLLGPDTCTIGGGTGPCALSPSAVVGGLTFATVSAGYLYTCGITTVGTAYCWGDNLNGELGSDTIYRTPTPAAVAGQLTFATISAGRTHTCGVTTSGTTYCWGEGRLGELGTGGPPSITNVPEPVAGGLTFTEVSAGNEHTCGVTTSGAAYCWGSNLIGELGTGVTTGPEQCRRAGDPAPRACAHSPVPVAGGLRFNAVSVGFAYTCGVTTNGAAYCWGHTYGAAPVPVASGLTFTAVSAGNGTDGRYTCGLTTGGAAYCWYTDEAAAPVAVGGGLSFAAASMGNSDDHACGITVAGVAYCWGYGAYGQLGVGTQTVSSVPVKVAYQP